MAVKRNTPTAAILTNLYKTIQEIITDQDAYYTQDEIEALKTNQDNIFLSTKGKTK